MKTTRAPADFAACSSMELSALVVVVSVAARSDQQQLWEECREELAAAAVAPVSILVPLATLCSLFAGMWPRCHL